MRAASERRRTSSTGNARATTMSSAPESGRRRGCTTNVHATMATPTVTMPASTKLAQSRPGACWRIISSRAAARTTYDPSARKSPEDGNGTVSDCSRLTA